MPFCSTTVASSSCNFKFAPGSYFAIYNKYTTMVFGHLQAVVDDKLRAACMSHVKQCIILRSSIRFTSSGICQPALYGTVRSPSHSLCCTLLRHIFLPPYHRSMAPRLTSHQCKPAAVHIASLQHTTMQPQKMAVHISW